MFTSNILLLIFVIRVKVRLSEKTHLSPQHNLQLRVNEKNKVKVKGISKLFIWKITATAFQSPAKMFTYFRISHNRLAESL